MAMPDHSHVDTQNAGNRTSFVGGGDECIEVSEGSNDGQRVSGESSAPEVVPGLSEKDRGSSASNCCSVVVDLEHDEVVLQQLEAHLDNVVKDCRICHLSLDATDHEFGIPIELGCSCKDDLAVAHKHCAEAWFKIKGNKTCEICGSTACNVAGANEPEAVDEWNDASDSVVAATTVPARPAETRNFWQGHRFLNFLLACMVFAFVISWLFHFNVPS